MNEIRLPAGDTSTDHRTAQAYILFSISLLLVVTIGSLVQLKSVRIGLGITEVVLILLPALLFIRRKRVPVAEALQWRPVSASVVAMSILVGATGWGIAAGIIVLTHPLIGWPPSIEALEPGTLTDLWWVLLAGALLPGICEETLFRGAIQGILSRLGERRAVLITALLFAVYHVNPWVLLPAFFLGIVFGVLVVRTGSTFPAMLAHISNNAVAFTVSYLYDDQPESAAFPLIGILAAACCITFPAFWLMTRRHRASPSILASVPAGVVRRGRWIFGLIGGAVVLIVAAAIGAALMLVDLQSVSDDSLRPDAQPGDQIVVFKSGLVDLDPDLEVDDIVSYDGSETAFHRIVRVDQDSVWIRDRGGERGISRKQITGKVVHIIKSADLAGPE